MPKRTIHHVFCNSSHCSSWSILYYTVKCDHIWMMKFWKNVSFSPELSSLRKDANINLLASKYMLIIFYNFLTITTIKRTLFHFKEKETTTSYQTDIKWQVTSLSCSDVRPVKQLFFILLIATSDPLHFPWYTVPNVPEPSSLNSSRSSFLMTYKLHQNNKINKLKIFRQTFAHGIIHMESIKVHKKYIKQIKSYYKHHNVKWEDKSVKHHIMTKSMILFF
jgi:hypothetical protein